MCAVEPEIIRQGMPRLDGTKGDGTLEAEFVSVHFRAGNALWLQLPPRPAPHKKAFFFCPSRPYRFAFTACLHAT